jgi:hypothetical protein
MATGCALPDQACKVHRLLDGPKALHWTSGDHFDFYDRPEKVHEAATVVAAHFRRYLPHAPPRLHVVRYHGVLAPRSRERAQIVPGPRPDAAEPAGDGHRRCAPPAPAVDGTETSSVRRAVTSRS